MFDGTQSSLENDWLQSGTRAWEVIDGNLHHEDVSGSSHLFYDGPNSRFTSFEMVCEWKSGVGTNSGIYFHTEYQADGFPAIGNEAQINNTSSAAIDKKTGSLFGTVNLETTDVQDEVWNKQRIVVLDTRVVIEVNDETTVDIDFETFGRHIHRPLGSGLIALQGEGLGGFHDKIIFRKPLYSPPARKWMRRW